MNINLGVLSTDYEKNKKQAESVIQTFILYPIKTQTVSELTWKAKVTTEILKFLQYQTTVHISHLHRTLAR